VTGITKKAVRRTKSARRRWADNGYFTRDMRGTNIATVPTPRRRCRYSVSMCETPQARHSKVTTSGSPSKRAVRRMSCIGCAQLGQRGGMSAELCAFGSHIVMVPGWRPLAGCADPKIQARQFKKRSRLRQQVGAAD